MKHVQPPHDAASLDKTRRPALPHEQGESRSSQAGGSPQQRDQGRQALRNATDGTADTDSGPVMDQVYNDKVAPDRGPQAPRR